MLLIQQVMAQVGKPAELDVKLREMLHLMSMMLGLNRGRIVLRDGEGDLCRIAHSYGLTREEVERGCYRLGEGITGQAIENRQLIILQDIDREPGFLARAVKRDRLPAEAVSFIAMPIQCRSATVGALCCHRLRHRPRLLTDDITVLRILATLTGQLLEIEANLEEKTRSLEQHNAMLSRALETATARYGIIGTSATLLRAITQLEQVAAAGATVLLLGESGTGKELFAHALHLASPRCARPFIKVNCAAIPEGSFETELFGSERSDATGGRPGWFEHANQGTIFLDEIGDLPLAMQAKLLRTMQEGTISRPGAKQDTPIDVRIVASTHSDLGREVAAGRFREDLYYRLNVIPIRLPALGERLGDIRELASHFLVRFNQAYQRNVNLTPAAIERLKIHPWPGNVRQLSNVMERLVLLAEQTILDEHDVEAFLLADLETRAAPPAPDAESPVSRPYAAATSHALSDLTAALAASGGNKSRAAQLMGLTERQFSYRLRKLSV
jgi:Nif-specific regulatory protein